ncbi:transcription initiation factor IIF, beta subunit [Dunaliella salina]|uniref:Transcription initiation factor IIF, beta subunit n=1 Tax=Dunaliella salina TaxID=3046 RepID=A0ABQ7GH94_DUNSA|nr:transcription initiation factor IIF, beta subunit [Dunaliella salina]|eukprot:KAF5833971.1 transcription initiation factor IIF, beta subunit [Dunaliella salina]
MSEDSTLDLEKLHRKVWLVKVPNAIARVWRPICEQSMNPANMDIEEDLPQLGKVQVQVSNATGKLSRDLRLIVPNNAGASASQQQQQQQQPGKAYQLSQLPIHKNGTMSAISYKRPATEDGEEPPAQLRAEGTVELSLNAAPMTVQDGQGHMMVDDEYCNLSKQRNREAATRTRTVRTYEDNRANHMALVANKRAVDQATKRKGEEQRRNREDNKRVRVDAPVLERELFRLFELQPSWTFQQLQLETKQPTMHLKAVLEQIAVFQKRGQGKDAYVLKEEYAVGDQEAGGDEQQD